LRSLKRDILVPVSHSQSFVLSFTFALCRYAAEKEEVYLNLVLEFVPDTVGDEQLLHSIHT
jgi:hypothetical protein